VARQVIVRVLCDPCLAAEVETDGLELPPLKLAEISGKPRVITLCEVHRKEFYEPFLEILQELGQPVDEDGNASGPRGHYRPRSRAVSPDAAVGKPAVETPDGIACPSCGHVSPNRSALSAHTRDQHGKTLAELEGKPLPYACQECGDKFESAKGRGAHRFHVHGVRGSSKSVKSAAARRKAETKS
jgi:hypothetical protein